MDSFNDVLIDFNSSKEEDLNIVFDKYQDNVIKCGDMLFESIKNTFGEVHIFKEFFDIWNDDYYLLINKDKHIFSSDFLEMLFNITTLFTSESYSCYNSFKGGEYWNDINKYEFVNTRTNCYFIKLAPTGSGKSHSYKFIKGYVDDVSYRYVYSNISSGQAIRANILSHFSNKGFSMIIDEMSETILSTLFKQNELSLAEASLRKTILENFASGDVPGDATKDYACEGFINSCFSIYACSTPQNIPEIASMGTGYIERYMITCPYKLSLNDFKFSDLDDLDFNGDSISEYNHGKVEKVYDINCLKKHDDDQVLLLKKKMRDDFSNHCSDVHLGKYDDGKYARCVLHGGKKMFYLDVLFNDFRAKHEREKLDFDGSNPKRSAKKTSLKELKKMFSEDLSNNIKKQKEIASNYVCRKYFLTNTKSIVDDFLMTIDKNNDNSMYSRISWKAHKIVNSLYIFFDCKKPFYEIDEELFCNLLKWLKAITDFHCFVAMNVKSGEKNFIQVQKNAILANQKEFNKNLSHLLKKEYDKIRVKKVRENSVIDENSFRERRISMDSLNLSMIDGVHLKNNESINYVKKFCFSSGKWSFLFLRDENCVVFSKKGNMEE